MPEYPILQQNKPIGTLRVTREGLHTVFSARATTDAPRLRLAVCGTRSRAYLGLMLPDGSGALTLTKRLTRLECAPAAGDPVRGGRGVGHSGRVRACAGTGAAVCGRWPGCALVFCAGRRAHDV